MSIFYVTKNISKKLNLYLSYAIISYLPTMRIEMNR